jgi:hypothetical protein
METTPVSTSSRTLKVRAAKSTAATPRKATKAVSVKRKPKAIVKPVPLDPDQLKEMIATAAYFIAQKRHFAPGDELSDWFLAEQQVLTAHAANA